jgi:hypothetical protein
MIYDFSEQLEWSKETLRQYSDAETLRNLFPGSTGVAKTGTELDRAGVDYLVTLRRGAVLKVDAKARSRGCARHWCPRDEPEVALERWSVLPGGKYATPRADAKAGWTLDESKDVDLILFTFHPDDHPIAYVRSLPLLREAFRRNCGLFFELFKTDVQDSRRWQSECVFVPLRAVDQAIEAVSRTPLIAPSAH